MKKILPFVFAAAFIFASCASFERTAGNKIGYKEIAEEKLGNKIEYLFNEACTYVIALKRDEETAQNPFPFTRFIIFKVEGSKIIFEERLMISEIKWISNTEVEAVTLAGIVSSTDPERKSGYLFNAAEGKKIEL